LTGVIAHATAPVGAWWFTNFDYRYPISIPAGASILPINYSIPVTFNHAAAVTAGKSLASGDDVRVVWWNPGTLAWVELDRVIDPDNGWNSATTTVWFRTQAAIGAGATNTDYYLYYGDVATAAAPLQNELNVFSFFDDFPGAAIDATKWTTSATVTVAGGNATVDGGARLRSVNTYPVDTIWETRARVSTVTPAAPNYYWAANSTNNNNFGNYLRFRADNTANDAAQLSSGATTNFVATAPTALQYYSFSREGAGGAARFFHNGAVVASFANGADTTALRVFMRNEANAGQTQVYAWARVRVYRNPEPVSSLAALEQLAMPTVAGEWRFDQTSWTGAAGEVLDSGPNGLHMTAFPASPGNPTTANATPAIAGDPGSCRYGVFNGTDQYVQVADNPALDLPNQVSVTAWVYPRSLPAAGLLKSIWSKDTNYEMHLSSSGQVDWWWGGGAQELITTGTAVPLNQWSHIAVTYQSGMQRIYINGVLRASGTTVGTLTLNAVPFQIGQDQGFAGRFWNGFIDETRVYGAALSSAQVNSIMTQTRPCAIANHFLIGHDGFGITCAAVENVTVTVHDVVHNPVTSYNQPITLDTQTGRGTWTLVSGAGTFLDATANDGLATYQWPLGQSTATFALDYRSATPPSIVPPGVLSIDIDAYETGNPAFRDDDTEGLMNFSPSGFVVTSSPLSNPPPGAIPSFASPQIAGTNFTAYITAYGQTPTDTQCGVIEGYAGNKNLKFWSTYVDPGTGTRQVAINAGNIATTEAASAAQVVAFTSGQASVTALYKDAGRINIGMKDDTTGNPGLPTGIRGSTGNFVVRPATFVLSNIKRTSDGFANPAANNAGGTVFIAAGQPFSATVTAQESGGTVTPNFGKESTPESVSLTSALVLPAVGQNPAVSAPTGFGLFTNGVAIGTDFSWPEVGIVTLTPHIKDGDYLGAGDVVGTTTGNVGRFIPNDFATVKNVPSFQTACASGGFTYIGQPFVYSTAPVLSVTARALGGATTRNYAGAFFKLTNSTLTARTYTVVAATLDTSGVPATTSDPAIADLSNGLASLTFSAGTGLAILRTTPVAPFNAQISLSINIIDSDSVAASNPVTFSNIAFSNTAEQRYGRIAFRNAVGSELLNLPLPMHAEYFQSTSGGFTQSVADSCTTGVTTALTISLSAGGTTCLLNASSCPGPIGQQFQMPPLAGDFVAILKAPGAGKSGTVTVTTIVPAWLQFDWNTASPGLENPSGIATFGLFQGTAKRIFQIEK